MYQSYYCGEFEDGPPPKRKQPRPQRRQRRSWAGMRSFESWMSGQMSPKQWIIARAVMKRESEWRVKRS